MDGWMDGWTVLNPDKIKVVFHFLAPDSNRKTLQYCPCFSSNWTVFQYQHQEQCVKYQVSRLPEVTYKLTGQPSGWSIGKPKTSKDIWHQQKVNIVKCVQHSTSVDHSLLTQLSSIGGPLGNSKFSLISHTPGGFILSTWIIGFIILKFHDIHDIHSSLLSVASRVPSIASAVDLVLAGINTSAHALLTASVKVWNQHYRDEEGIWT